MEKKMSDSEIVAEIYRNAHRIKNEYSCNLFNPFSFVENDHIYNKKKKRSGYVYRVI